MLLSDKIKNIAQPICKFWEFS